MNAFTGGCHYDQGCGKFRSTCGACPQLGSTVTRDLAYRIWLRKREVYNAIPPNRIHFITPSRWLAREVEMSSLLGRFPVSVIPNGLNTAVFSPRDRSLGRDAMEVPQHACVLLFVSDSTENRRKGFHLLAEALEGLQENRNLCLLSLGTGNLQLKRPIPHLHLGHIKNDRLLSLIYSIADLFVIPSLQDNLPNTCLEALACGTPIVGFEVGGIPDMVRPGLTGSLAPAGNSIALRNAILDLIEKPDILKKMSVNSRRIAEAEYSLETQARRYVQLYEEMILR
jgi:glycosyltransferase involved in cell wall biosynthesis